MKKFLVFITFVLLFSSCSEYQKAMKSEDIAVKYDMAEKMYAPNTNKQFTCQEVYVPPLEGESKNIFDTDIVSSCSLCTQYRS